MIEPGWSVDKIKLMGADAVKLLAQFEPTEPIRRAPVPTDQHVYEECKKHDICAARNRGVPVRRREEDRCQLLNRKAETVIESARQLSRFCDVYKAEFPGTLGQETDSQLQDNLEALDAASERPWVLLRPASISPTTRSRWRWP